MTRRPGTWQRWPARTWFASLPLLATGCVTTYEPTDRMRPNMAPPAIAVPVAIPIPDLGDGDQRLLVQFYNGILRRLQEAADDGDIALLDALIANYDKPSLPEAIARHLAGYRAVGRGLAFEQHVRRAAELTLRSQAGEEEAPRETPDLGRPLALELRIPAMAEPVVLGGRSADERIGFAVSVRIEDEFADGRTHSAKTSDCLWLPATVELAGDSVLRLPIDVDANAGDSVRRRVFVRIDLLAGFVRVADVRAPVRRRATIAGGTWTQVPAGYDRLAAAPLRALRSALADFTPKNFPGAWLAAQLVPPEQRPQAFALLIDQVRFGRPDQATVAMAALARIADVHIAIGDRDAWLEWYETRR
ncbi:MAG TPA: hypothetical protein ENI87_04470 [bacterium]|nr:hypothetical protein [bacterium]